MQGMRRLARDPAVSVSVIAVRLLACETFHKLLYERKHRIRSNADSQHGIWHHGTVDPLTHTLTGAAMAQTKLAEGCRKGLATLVIGANLPDIDVFSFIAGGDASLAWRRGWSHGPVAMLVFPVLLAWVMLFLDRRAARSAGRTADRFPVLLGLATLGVWSHPMLDWLNTYGVRLLMPFDNRWFYGDALFIVDPWVWLVLGGSVFLAGARRAEGSQASDSRRRSLRWGVVSLLAATVVLLGPANDDTDVLRVVWVLGLTAIVAARRLGLPRWSPARLATSALLLVATYAVTMALLSGFAAREIRQQLTAAGTPSQRLMAGPVPLHPLRRMVIAETQDGYRKGRYDFTRTPRLQLDPRSVLRPASAEIDRAWADPSVQGFRGWARFPLASETAHDHGRTVFLFDLRYTDQPTQGFGGATVELDATPPTDD